MPDLIPILSELQRMLSSVTPTIVQPVVVLATALFAGLTVRSVASRISLAPSPQRSLSAYLAQPESDSTTRFRWDDQEAMILASLGLPTRTGLLRWICIASVAVPGVLLLLTGMPLALAIGAGALCYVLTNSFLASRWRRVRVQIEQELPTFVARLAGTLLVTASPNKAIAEVTETLNDDSLLKQWFVRLVANTRLEGSSYFDTARNEAAQLSPSLALVVFELGRFFETGGAGFARAFATTAEELSAILEARAVAGSKAESARGAVLMMLAIIAGILTLMLSSPNIRQGFDSPAVQMISLAALVTMGGGYLFLNGMIDEAMDG